MALLEFHHGLVLDEKKKEKTSSCHARLFRRFLSSLSFLLASLLALLCSLVSFRMDAIELAVVLDSEAVPEPEPAIFLASRRTLFCSRRARRAAFRARRSALLSFLSGTLSELLVELSLSEGFAFIVEDAA